ncbi:MAG: sulfurtransferase [Candidatus Cloacimonadota bacterium]|nr:MAG: sulfurtransferase [Candidatus Cloacimonadota bacterium]
MKTYDVIVIGAGSTGVPATMAIAEKGQSVLCIEALSAPGQGNHKKAIGGIRATHSDYGKIKTSLRSIEIFSQWKEKYGTDIGWQTNGYSFPAYDEKTEKNLKNLLKVQQGFGLDIKWITPEEYRELVPGINMEGLRGASYSPGDGSASNLLAINSMWFRSKKAGAEYKFNERVIKFEMKGDKILEVITDKGRYACGKTVNAAGNYANEIGKLAGIELCVSPDNHEAAISEPVKRFMEPMIVDLRSGPGSKNFYFYQNADGQVLFCITPDPPVTGIRNESTSVFLPQIAKRMLTLYPSLANLKVRRSWRGQYPMTPDGFPIAGYVKEVSNYINAVGMCGQGFMLGPGLGEIIARLTSESITEEDRKILKSFDFYRDFSGMEAFK